MPSPSHWRDDPELLRALKESKSLERALFAAVAADRRALRQAIEAGAIARYRRAYPTIPESQASEIALREITWALALVDGN